MSVTVMDYRTSPYGQHPHRKALPAGSRAIPPQQLHSPQLGVAGYTSPALSSGQGSSRSHSRTRTSSSSVFPQFQSSSPNYQSTMGQYDVATPARRTLSNATASTSSSNGRRAQQKTYTMTSSNNPLMPVRTNSNYSRRSSRSNTSTSTSQPQLSYVALMRKQKATVWCDRSQQLDPRIIAAQRAAKARAAAEVVGGHNTQGRTSTSSSGVVGGVRSKIRHHGAPKASAYTAPVTLGPGGVPMRLSASEVGDDDSDPEEEWRTSSMMGAGFYPNDHRRSGSGRSSLGSDRRVFPAGVPQGGRYSASSTPPSGQGSSPADEGTQARMAELAEEETPVPGNYGANDYFHAGEGKTRTGLSAMSGGSGSSGERENSFGNVGQIPIRTKPKPTVEQEKSAAEDLRRRGSVDDRTMTMGGRGRLFVANPDLSD